jgi:preprotein translocase subunit YajC
MGTLAAAEAASKSSSSGFTFVILIVLVFGAFYFLMIRPQRRRQQQVAQQQNTVNPGARVRTTAGMYATVVAVDGDDVVLEIAPDVEVRYMRRAIMEVISPAEEAAEDTEYADGTEYGEDSEYTADSEYTEGDGASAQDGLTDSHDQDETVADTDDDLASSNGTKAKSDSDVF